MVSIIGCAGNNDGNLRIIREGSVFNPVFYPPLTRYYSSELQGAVFGLFDRDAGKTERGLLVDSGLLLAADADIFNVNEIKEKLKIEKQRKIDSAEAILLSYKQWGRACVQQLHGDYAFAIWDAGRNELFCARDPMGVRPFYYFNCNGTFVFSSELRPLKSLYQGTLKLNKDFFLDTLVTHISSNDLTAFENIFRLPPAHYLYLYNGNVALQKYWEPDINKKIRLKSPADYYEMLSENLNKAVSERISSESAFGAELSGGLDSSLITAIAFDESIGRNVPFYALSNTLPGNAHNHFKDEKEFIMKVIESRKMPWIEVSHSNRTLKDMMSHNVKLHGSFLQQRFGMFNDMLYQKAADNKIKYLFSGFGGDELLSARIGTPWNDIIRDGHWNTFFSLLRFKKNRVGAVKNLIIFLGWDILTMRYTFGIFNKSLLEKRFSMLALKRDFCEENGLWERYREKYRRENCKYLSQRQLQRLNHPHIPQRMEYCYTSAAFYNVKYFYPLLDSRLIDSYFSVPPHIRYGEDGNRFLFRVIMKGYAVDEIHKRNDKSGVTIPYIQPKFEEERDLFFTLFEKYGFKDELAGIFDFSKMQGWYERLVARGEDDKNYLMYGAFYSYIMIMIYLYEQEAITGL